MSTIVKLPENFKDLSEHAPLMYNLGENKQFQPVHFDFRGPEPFVILGRFSGQTNPNGSSFKLSKIELALYTWSTTTNTDPSFLVNKASVDNQNTKWKELHINLELQLLEKMDPEKKKRRLKDSKPECELTPAIDVFKDGRIFFHIINYDDFLESGDVPLNTTYVSGRNCNGKPVLPGG